MGGRVEARKAKVVSGARHTVICVSRLGPINFSAKVTLDALALLVNLCRDECLARKHIHE